MAFQSNCRDSQVHHSHVETLAPQMVESLLRQGRESKDCESLPGWPQSLNEQVVRILDLDARFRLTDRLQPTFDLFLNRHRCHRHVNNWYRIDPRAHDGVPTLEQ